MIKPGITVTPGALVVGVGVVVGVFVAYRAFRAVEGAIDGVRQGFGDMTDWVLSIPGNVQEYARAGGETWLDNTTPRPVNRQNDPSSFDPVYRDPLINDDGTNFNYF